MAHELSIRSDGFVEAFYAGDGQHASPAWHGLGQLVINAPSSADALRLAGLDWTVKKVPVQAVVGDGATAPAPDFRAIVRNDTKAVLGVVTDRYEPVQNTEAFSFLDQLNMDGIVKYESAGALRGGRQVWVLARTHTAYRVTDRDVIQPYILFTAGHDGRQAIRITPTNVRVVCANTLRVALRDTDNMITLRHDRAVRNRLDVVLKVLQKAFQSAERNIEQSFRLAQRKLNDHTVLEYIRRLVPLPADSGPSYEYWRRIQRRIEYNYFEHPNQQLPGIARTAWAAYNAVSQYVDHESRARSAESRFRSIISGDGDKLKQRAFELAAAL